MAASPTIVNHHDSSLEYKRPTCVVPACMLLWTASSCALYSRAFRSAPVNCSVAAASCSRSTSAARATPALRAFRISARASWKWLKRLDLPTRSHLEWSLHFLPVIPPQFYWYFVTKRLIIGGWLHYTDQVRRGAVQGLVQASRPQQRRVNQIWTACCCKHIHTYKCKHVGILSIQLKAIVCHFEKQFYSITEVREMYCILYIVVIICILCKYCSYGHLHFFGATIIVQM